LCLQISTKIGSMLASEFHRYCQWNKKLNVPPCSFFAIYR
jgi:hypothetical protein